MAELFLTWSNSVFMHSCLVALVYLKGVLKISGPPAHLFLSSLLHTDERGVPLGDLGVKEGHAVLA